MTARGRLAAALAAGLCWTALSAHPIDEQEIRSSAEFKVARNSVEFRLVFPAEAYVRYAPGIERPPAVALRELPSEEAVRHIKTYVEKNVLVFDGKRNLAIADMGVAVRRNAVAVEELPSAVVVEGVFGSTAPIRDLYIFNDIFREAPVPHVGDATVAWKNKVYDFEFRKGVYFHLDLTSPPTASSR